MPRPLQDPYEEPSEERRQAAIKSIEAKEVKVENAEDEHHGPMEYVDAGLDEAKRLNLPLPGAIRIDRDFAKRADNVVGMPLAYDPKRDVVLIDPDSIFTQAGMIHLRRSMEGAFRGGVFSTDHPLHIARHELGHVAHAKTGKLSGEKFDSGDHREIAATVSQGRGSSPTSLWPRSLRVASPGSNTLMRSASYTITPSEEGADGRHSALHPMQEPDDGTRDEMQSLPGGGGENSR